METEPAEDQILEQLERITASNGFAESPRKQKFLQYIVEKTLAGESTTLKGYAIGVDVFDRGAKFDPQLDTIVRVQARNLRRALEIYNLTEGANDRVHIKLQKGSYVPTFEFVKKTLANNATSDGENSAGQLIKTKSDGSSRTHAMDAKIILALFAAILAVTILISYVKPESQNGFDQAMVLPMGPSISVEPFLVAESGPKPDFNSELKNLQAGLHVELVGKISRFKDLFVVKTNGVDKEIKTQFELSGTIQRSGDEIRVSSVLKRQSTGQVLWSRTYVEVLDNPSALLKIQSRIAVDVATSLGQPYSRINSRFLAEQSYLSDLDLDHYICLMGFYNYSSGKTEAEHERIRACLEKATKETPSFSSGWAALSWMYLDEQFNGFNVRPDAGAPVERALSAAQKAVRADPDNAMAYQYLAIARYTSGDDDGFRQAAETALRLNPNDAEVLADVGSYLIQIENSDQGAEMVNKAIAMNPAHPAWYHGSIFMYHYSRDQTEMALHHAREYLVDGSIAAHMVYTAVLIQDGQLEAGQQAYRDMIEIYPQFPTDYQEIIEGLRFPEEMINQLIEDLTIAGLATVF